MRLKEDVMYEEHSRLVAAMNEISLGSGAIGRTFSEVLKIFQYHLDREEETALPLLKYLSDRMSETKPMADDRLFNASEAFKVEYESMLEEHRQIEMLLSNIQQHSSEGQYMRASETAKELHHHVLLEEQILYPAAMAAAELIDTDGKNIQH